MCLSFNKSQSGKKPETVQCILGALTNVSWTGFLGPQIRNRVFILCKKKKNNVVHRKTTMVTESSESQRVNTTSTTYYQSNIILKLLHYALCYSFL